MANRCAYEELKAAVKQNPEDEETLAALGEWFEECGNTYWNGEYYDADEAGRLYPVYAWDGELDQGTIVGWELR